MIESVHLASFDDFADEITVLNVVVEAGDIVVVGIGWRGDTGAVLISSVVRDGQSYAVVPGAEAVTNVRFRAALWYHAAPNPGTVDLVVSFSGFASEQSVTVWVLSGRNAASPLRTAAADITPSLSPESEVDDDVLDYLVVPSGFGTPVVGAAQTERQNVDVGTYTGSASDEPGAASSTTMSWTGTSGENPHVAVAVKAAAGQDGHLPPAPARRIRTNVRSGFLAPDRAA